MLTGRDTNPLEVKSIFTALIRLKEALRANDEVQMSRAVGLVDDRLSDINFVRADVGIRQQTIDAMTDRLKDESEVLQASLSEEIDVDFAEATSNLIARMAALQAALQTTAQISRMTVLDFL